MSSYSQLSHVYGLRFTNRLPFDVFIDVFGAQGRVIEAGNVWAYYNPPEHMDSFIVRCSGQGRKLWEQELVRGNYNIELNGARHVFE